MSSNEVFGNSQKLSSPLWVDHSVEKTHAVQQQLSQQDTYSRGILKIENCVSCSRFLWEVVVLSSAKLKLVVLINIFHTFPSCLPLLLFSCQVSTYTFHSVFLGALCLPTQVILFLSCVYNKKNIENTGRLFASFLFQCPVP